MNIAAISREFGRIGSATRGVPRATGEAFWNLGRTHKTIRQLDTILFIKKFEKLRRDFFQSYWSAQAEMLGATPHFDSNDVKFELNGRVLHARDGQLLKVSGIVDDTGHQTGSTAFDWHRSHPIYSSDHRSIVSLLFLDRQLLGAVRSTPPVVIGDGHSTIYQLVRRENQRRLAAQGWFALNPLLVDTRTRLFLLINNLHLDDVPETGRAVQIKFGVEENNRFANLNVESKIAADVIDACGGLLAQSGNRLVGIVLGCEEAEGMIERQSCSLLDVSDRPNLTPFILSGNPHTPATIMRTIAMRWQT